MFRKIHVKRVEWRFLSLSLSPRIFAWHASREKKEYYSWLFVSAFARCAKQFCLFARAKYPQSPSKLNNLFDTIHTLFFLFLRFFVVDFFADFIFAIQSLRLETIMVVSNHFQCKFWTWFEFAVFFSSSTELASAPNACSIFKWINGIYLPPWVPIRCTRKVNIVTRVYRLIGGEDG